ncbi:MAG: hypothetical protein AVDCRST_MAG56-7484, partial [uncultured Cytophagales bacterium]
CNSIKLHSSESPQFWFAQASSSAFSPTSDK